VSTETVQTAWKEYLPLKPYKWDKPDRMKRVHTLADWAGKTMEDNHAEIGVISRCGSFLTVLYDQTCMSHSGIVFRHPETQKWIVYNLYSDPATNLQHSRLWQQSVEDFFYTQDSIKTDGMVLIPGETLQKKLLKRMQDVPFNTLLPPDEHFNLVAPMSHHKSFNCTKWIMSNVYAAEKQLGSIEDVLEVMNREHQIPTLHAGPLTRFVMGFKRDTHFDEFTPPGEVRTVTVGSMYASPLFEKRFMYSNKKITQDNEHPGMNLSI